MKTVRYTAAVATVILSLLNLPFAFDDGGSNFPKAVDVAVTLLGVVGIGAAVVLLLKKSWGPLAVVVVGAINLIGAIAGLVANMQGAIIGLVLSVIIIGLGLAAMRRPTGAARLA